jgi:Cu+-exporting ATPase
MKVRIGGMHCASCVSRVEKALLSVAEVKRAEIQLLSGTGILETEPEFEKNPDWARLAAALKSGGYSIEPMDPALAAPNPKKGPKGESTWDSKPFPAIASLLLGTGLMLTMALFPRAELNYWLGLAVALPVQIFWGRPFLSAILRFFTSLRAWQQSTMESLVGIGTTASLALSIAQPHHPYFEVSVFLIGFVRLGKWLELRAKTRTGDAVRSLLHLNPPMALLVSRTGQSPDPATPVTVSASSLRVGDHVRILAGERVPADGQVLSGHSTVDESWLSGESLPVEKAIGMSVLAGSKNGLGTLELRVTSTPGQSLLARIIERVERAQMSRAPIQRLADSLSARFVPAVLGVALLTWIAWLLLGGSLGQATLHAVSVLVIACPCALGLATPAALVVGLGRASQKQVLFKNGAALETLARARTLIFDKTGTLTEGRARLSAFLSLDSCSSESRKSASEWLAVAASAEQGSEHVLARALIEAAHAQNLTLSRPDRFEALPGQGVRASMDGKFILIGTARLLAEQGMSVSAQATDWIDARSREGATCIVLAQDFQPRAVFAFSDSIRPDAPELIAWLRRQGVGLRLVSGDRAATALSLGQKLGFQPSEIESEILPHQKEAYLTVLNQTIGPVAMIGDGINDAPALARAPVSVSLLGSSEAALDSAQVILMSGRISDLKTAILTSRSTLRTIRQNLSASALYNILGIPIAAGVFESTLGIGLTPELAGAAMAVSSVSVVLNSLRLSRLPPDRLAFK